VSAASIRRKALDELARISGVEVRYRNIGGDRVVATDSTIEGVLGALGVGAGSEAEIATSIKEQQRATSSRIIDPVIVIGSMPRCSFGTGPISESTIRSGVIHILTEQGDALSAPIRRLIATQIERTDGRRSIDLVTFDLPVGYHTLTLETPAFIEHAQVLVRPDRARRPRRAFGIFAPLYGLRSEHDWGIGSTTELGALGRWSAERGASFVGTLPLYPAFYEAPFEVSPYRPVSKVAWNEIFLDVERQPEIACSQQASALLSSQRLRRATKRLRSSDIVEYRAVFAAKKGVIAACADAVERGPRADRFRRFLADHPEIAAYARFRADREGKSELERSASVRYHQYSQFAMDAALDEVLSDSGVPLYLDLPLGVHPSGFDPQHYPTAFIPGASIGAPPDDFFVGGQNWGIPPLHPVGLRDGGFAYIVATFRHIFRRANVVRIDHVMGFERCFVIPAGGDAQDGAYVRYPSTELRAVAAIEAVRSGTTLVGEDLGTVPGATRAAMRRDGMLRSAVYEMEGSPSNPAPATDPRAVASVATHDLPRFAEFISGGDLERRISSGGLTHTEAAAVRAARQDLRRELTAAGDGEHGVARAYRGVLRWLAATEADLALVDLGDLLLDEEPENRPGPDSGRCSWRHRLPARIEDLVADHTVASRIAIVAAGRPTLPRPAR
jgi:4-alpha-glucanotransferase